MAGRSYRALLWGLVLVGLCLDQFGKYQAFRWLHTLPPPPSNEHAHEYVLIPGVFKLHAQFTGEPDAAQGVMHALRTWSADDMPQVNHGALFGLGVHYKFYANTLFAVVSVVAALAIIWWSQRPSTLHDGALCAALGLILAGTLGNLYDRLVFGGVRDFLYFHWFEWPVFNVADCCLVFGAGLLLFQAFWTQPVQAAKPAAVEALSTATAEAK
jgi:lipoprotein signal peptidase